VASTSATEEVPFGPPVKYPSKTSPRWAFVQWFDIPDARDISRVYLRRLRIIQTPWFGLLLHFIYTPDLDQDPHDHPFNFISVILRGGYTERVFKHVREHDFSYVRRRHLRFGVNVMPVRYAHQIDDMAPHTTTLVFAGRRQRDWGFWRADGWTFWKTYNKEKYGHEEKAKGWVVPVDEFG